MARKKTEDEELVDFIGESISTDSALLAASINLMRAGDIAKVVQDTDALLKVAKGWYDIARYMAGDQDDDSKSAHFGFAALEVVDEPGREPHESEGGIEVRKKSRKL